MMVGHLAGLQLHDGGVGGGVALHLRLLDEAHVAAVGGGVLALGEVHGDGAEVLAGVEPVLQRLDLLQRFFGVVALEPCRFPACCAGRPVTWICARWYWFSMRLNSALCAL